MRGTYIGGFPEPERAIRGAPEAPRVLRRKSCCAESPVARKTRSGESLPRAKIRLRDCTIMN